jgi:hypothetical protein
MRLRKKRRGHRNGGKRGLKFVKTTIEGNLLGGRSRYFEVLRKENVQRGKGNTICLSVESQSIGLHTKRGSVRDGVRESGKTFPQNLKKKVKISGGRGVVT